MKQRTKNALVSELEWKPGDDGYREGWMARAEELAWTGSEQGHQDGWIKRPAEMGWQSSEPCCAGCAANGPCGQASALELQSHRQSFEPRHCREHCAAGNECVRSRDIRQLVPTAARPTPVGRPPHHGGAGEIPLDVGCVSLCANEKQIIGCDNRVRGALTLNQALQKPWSQVGRVTLGGGIDPTVCSGTVIKTELGRPKWVLTAAHCLWDNGQWRFGEGQFTPGDFSQNCKPFGVWSINKAWVPVEYERDDDPAIRAFDWALLRIETILPNWVPVPPALEAMEWCGPAPWNGPCWALDAVLQSEAYTIGYPFDKVGSSSWVAPGEFLGFDEYGSGSLYRVTCDGVGAASGGPLFVLNQQGGAHLVGPFIGSPIAACLQGETWAAGLSSEAGDRIVQLIETEGNSILTMRERQFYNADFVVYTPWLYTCP